MVRTCGPLDHASVPSQWKYSDLMAASKLITDAFRLALRFGVVDMRSYRAVTGEAFASPDKALDHYLSKGALASQTLFSFFDTAHYQAQLADALTPETTYFEHYVLEGAAQGLTPTPFFDIGYINQQVDGPPVENLLTFLADSRFKAVDPHIMFSILHYKRYYIDIDKAGVDPFAHFLMHGWRERRATHPFFGPAEYDRFGISNIQDVSEFNRRFMAASNDAALAQRQPMFDVARYVEARGIEADSIPPLQHFLTAGWRDGISPFPLFDIGFYQKQVAETPARRNPYIDYLSDTAHHFDPGPLFDTAYYLETVPGAKSFRGSLLEHFVRFGASQGARPHPSVAAFRTYPSEDSGLEIVNTLRDASGREMWFCRTSKTGWLAAQLDDMSDIEPALSARVLAHCALHPYTGPIDPSAKALIKVMTQIAQCNCVVISESEPEEWLINRIVYSNAALVSRMRPWLVLFGAASSTLRYWHAYRGKGTNCYVALPSEPADKIHFLAQALITSLPDRLVIRADGFGIALLRRCGAALLAAIAEVSLFFDSAVLEPHDRRWLIEFMAIHYSDFASILSNGKISAHAALPPGASELSVPRLIEL